MTSTATTPTARRNLLSRFTDLGVRVKVLAAIALSTAVAVLVGVLGLLALASSAATTESVYGENTLGIRYATAMEVAAGTMQQVARDAILSQNDAAYLQSVRALVGTERV